MQLLLLLAIGIVAAVWVMRQKPAEPATTADGNGVGSSPLPRPHLIEGPNERIIDLRPLPESDLQLGRFGATGAILRVQPPMPLQIYVVSLATARAWLSMSDVAVLLLLGRLKELRKSPDCQDFLYVADGRLDDSEQERFAACGMQIALDFTVVGSERSVNITEALAMPRAHEAGPKRPLLPYTVHGLGMFCQDLVFELKSTVFIDLRRAPPGVLESLGAFEFVDAALGKISGDKLWIWVIAPWVLERWRGREDEVVRRIGSWVTRQPGRHRLAIYDGTGKEPLVVKLAALGMSPVTEKLELKTDEGRWHVPLIKILDDVAAYEAAQRYAPRNKKAPASQPTAS